MREVVETVSIIASCRMPSIGSSHDAYLLRVFILKMFIAFAVLIALGVSVVFVLAYIFIELDDSDVHDDDIHCHALKVQISATYNEEAQDR